MIAAEENQLSPAWMQPTEEEVGLSRYVGVLRERWLLVAIVTTLTLAGAILYLATTEDVYEAEANLLVTPTSDTDPFLSSLPIPRESSDPTRDVETAARLATTLEIAERARETLGVRISPEALLDDISVEPVAESNLVEITAEGSSADEAANIANAFASAAVAQRTADFQEIVGEIRSRLQAELEILEPGDPARPAVEAAVARYQTLLQAEDPTIRAETEAAPPTSPSWPRPLLTLVGALLAGLILGGSTAFALQTLDPRLRREDQLRSRFGLPILTRVPQEGGALGTKPTPLAPGTLSPATGESYRTLRANLIAARRRHGERGSEAVMVTGSGISEGKTTTAINLATSLALAGKRTILIEADLRRPAIGSTLGIKAESGVASVLLGSTSLEETLVSAVQFGENLKLLLADHQGGWIAELFSLDSTERLIEEAKRLAEYVIVDSPPLTAVIDTLPLALRVDDVIVVCRLERTRLDKLRQLAELLATNQIKPLGFALIGTSRGERSGYHSYYQDRDQNRGRRDRRRETEAAPTAYSSG